MLTHKTNTISLIASFIVLITADYFYGLSWMLYAMVLFIWFVIAALGSTMIGMSYHVPAYIKNEAAASEIAITFDDGPTPFTLEILKTLENAGAKATFFCVGRQIEEYPEIFQRIVAEGHTVGNHSYTHSESIGFFSTSQIKNEIAATDVVILNNIRRRPTFYRPPFGVTNPQIARALKFSGHKVIGWSIRSLDTKIRSEKLILQRIKKRLKPGAIILLHDTSEKSVRVLEQLLVLARKNQLKPVTVDQLLNIPAYED